MAKHDYKPGRAKSSRKKKGSPMIQGWAWLVLGLAMGLFAGFLLYLSGRSPQPHTELTHVLSVPKHTATSPPAPTSQVTPAPSVKTKFDFYTLLPKLRVKVPKPSASQTASKKRDQSTGGTAIPPSSARKVTVNGRYMLQIASFGTKGQANVLKAKLAFQGIMASISSAKVNAYTWYRVQVGPYTRLDRLNAMIKQLTRQHFKPLVIKMNG